MLSPHFRNEGIESQEKLRDLYRATQHCSDSSKGHPSPILLTLKLDFFSPYTSLSLIFNCVGKLVLWKGNSHGTTELSFIQEFLLTYIYLQHLVISNNLIWTLIQEK